MNTQQLEALLIDEALGELSEEASALLSTYLDHFPERHSETGQIRRAVELTQAAVASRPLVNRADVGSGEVVPFRGKRAMGGVLRFAAIITLLGLAVGGGFLAGRSSPDSSRETFADSKADTAPSPWARYRFEENGRLAVITSRDPKS